MDAADPEASGVEGAAGSDGLGAAAGGSDAIGPDTLEAGTIEAGTIEADATLSAPLTRRQVLGRVARMGLALVAVAILIYVGTRNASDLSHVSLRLSPWWLVAAFPFYAASSLLLALGWRQELAAFGHRLPVRVAIRIWWRAQVARYIPSGLAAFASRAALVREEGVPPSLGAASLAVELATVIGWGCVAAAIGVPSSLLATPLRVALGVAAGAGLIALPLAYQPIARLGGRIPALRTLASTRGSRPALYGSIGYYGLSIVLKSVAFVFFGAALVSTRSADALLLAGSVQAAAVIGIIGITPAGVGVREGAMIGLLSHRFGTTDAAAMAVAWRAWEFSFELSWLGVGTLVGRRRATGAPAPAESVDAI